MPSGPQTIGRYEVVEMIGQGGMGRVYRARDPLIDRVVAVKTIELDYGGANQQDLRQRILREVRAAGRLHHPNIVQVFDVGELPDKAYIVMELVEGRTLWELYDADERPEPAEAIRILEQVADALDHAHGQGIIHRDVKPGNILIDARGTAKITDFGIARILADERLTQTGMIVGTPHYMAPEQLQEVGVGPEADQFALAVNAYELLTGRRPFEGETFSSLLYSVLNEDPPSIAELRPDLPAAVEKALARGLSKDRGERYRSCRDLADALAGALGGQAPSPQQQPPPQRKTTPWMVAAAVAAGVTAIAAVVVLRPGDPPPEPAPQAVVAPAQPEAQPVVEPPPAQQPEPQPPTAATVRPEPSPATPTAALEPAAPAPNTDDTAAGPVVTVVWRGRLEAGETLVIEDGSASAGSLSRPLPTAPMRVEVSPSSVEVVEEPGPGNGWSRLRVRNTEHARTMFFVRYRPLGP